MFTHLTLDNDLLSNFFPSYVREDPPKWNLFIKKLCVYSYMFKLQSLSKYALWCNIPIETSFHCSEQFLNSLILMPFSAPAIFLFNLLNVSKMFPFEDFSHLGKQKKVAWGEIG